MTIPKTRQAKNNGTNEIARLTAEDIVLESGKIYFGIYTLVINLELPLIEVRHIDVHSLKNEKQTT